MYVLARTGDTFVSSLLIGWFGYRNIFNNTCPAKLEKIEVVGSLVDYPNSAVGEYSSSTWGVNCLYSHSLSPSTLVLSLGEDGGGVPQCSGARKYVNPKTVTYEALIN